MNIPCTDKTGTLTQDKLVLELHGDLFGEESVEVLECPQRNGYYQTGFKNLPDVAVLGHPQRWKPELLSRFNIFFGRISSVLGITACRGSCLAVRAWTRKRHSNRAGSSRVC
jgi:magnesium-transporting ATPase (P-type)